MKEKIVELLESYNPQHGISVSDVDIISEEIVDLFTESQWISVEELLPEVTKKNPKHEVLTWTETPFCGKRILTDTYELCGKIKMFSSEADQCKPTHWMEKPEPPEGLYE